jgi:hypothetical protein
MRPQWFKCSEIPFSCMWPDDYMWYPHMLSGKYLDAYILFEGNDRVLESKISVRDTQTANNDQTNHRQVC